MGKRKAWSYEGPVSRNGQRDCIDFRAYTIATSKEEAERNIIWQYKIKFSLFKADKITLEGILYTTQNLPKMAQPKKKVEYDYEQLEMDL